MNRSQEYQILQGTSQVKQTTSKIIPKVTRLQFHVVAYTRENKHKGRYSIKKKSGKHSKQQQGCTNVEKRTMDQKNDSKDDSIVKKRSKRKFKSIK